MSAYVDTRELAEELDALLAADDLDEEDRERQAELEELELEIGSEWRDGATMIPEDEFEDYARELAEDIGAIDSDARLAASLHQLGARRARARHGLQPHHVRGHRLLREGVMRWELEDLASAADIADALATSPPAVSNWQARYAEFPAPLVRVARGDTPLWSMRQVMEWYVGKFPTRAEAIRRMARLLP